MSTVQVERRRNRVANPSFETNATGWTAGGGATIARSTTRAWSGSASLLVTTAAGGPTTQSAYATVSGLTAGVSYTISARLWVPSASLSASWSLYIFEVGPIGPLVDVADQWVHLTGTFTATAATQTLAVVAGATVTAGRTVFVDAAFLEVAAAAGDYFDGSTAATGSAVGDLTYAWSGTAHGSTSIEYEIVPRYNITATAEPDTVPPRVRIDILDRHPSSTAGVTLTRLDPDGRTRPVRTFDGGVLALSGPAGARIATIYDHEVPYGAPVTYSTAEVPVIVSSAVTVAVAQPWLISVVAPALSLPVTIAEMGPRTRPVARAIYRPMGRRTAIAHTDGQRKAPEYDMTVRTGTLAELAALLELCDDSQVLLLNVPADLGWGVGAEYISVGDLQEARLYQYGPEQRRHWPMPCTVVDRPEGGTTATRVLETLAGEAPTLAGLAALYPTSLYDMAVG